MLPNLSRLSLVAGIGAPVDQVEEPAQDQVFRELSDLIVEQLVSGLDGEGVCQSVADYCLAQPSACKGEAVWQAALGAFGITTRKDKDSTSMLVLGWIFPRPMRPPLTDQQLFKLLCNKLMPVMHNWDNPIARVEHQDDVSQSDWERYGDAQWDRALADLRNRSSAVPNYEKEARAWHLRMLTLPGKRGLTQMERDCLSGFYVGAYYYEGKGNSFSVVLGRLLNEGKGDWKRIPWIKDGTVTDARIIAAVNALPTDEYIRIRAGREVESNYHTNMQQVGYNPNPNMRIPRKAFYTELAQRLLGADVSEVLDDSINPHYDDRTLLDRFAEVVRYTMFDRLAADFPNRSWARPIYEYGHLSEYRVGYTAAFWAVLTRVIGPGLGEVRMEWPKGSNSEEILKPVWSEVDLHDTYIRHRQVKPDENDFRVWCLGAPTPPPELVALAIERQDSRESDGLW